jgi:hypothetical protein
MSWKEKPETCDNKGSANVPMLLKLPLQGRDEEKPWSARVLGDYNPKALISTLCYLLT